MHGGEEPTIALTVRAAHARARSLGRPLLLVPNDTARVEHQDTSGKQTELGSVGRDHDHVVPGELAHDLRDKLDAGPIEVCLRLVEKKQRSVAGTACARARRAAV